MSGNATISPGEIVIYTDGAARGNPGPGGLGVVMLYGKHRKELSEGYRLTTNNRMELLAVIRGLEALKRNDLKVKIYTDSRYVSDAVNEGWVFNWEAKRFKKKKNVGFMAAVPGVIPAAFRQFCLGKGTCQYPGE